MRACFTSGGPAPKCLREYMGHVYRLEYQELPDYPVLKQLFLTELKSHKMKDDPKGLDWLPSRKVRVRQANDTISLIPRPSRGHS